VTVVQPFATWDLADAYLMTFGTDFGRRVLQDLEKESLSAGQGVVPEGVIDPYRTHVNAGRQQLYDHIRVMLALAKIEDRAFPEEETAPPVDAFGDVQQEANRG
jgi:hypothetical protein